MIEISINIPIFTVMVIMLSYLAFAYVVSWITMIYLYVSDNYVSQDKLKSVVQLHYMFPIVPFLLAQIAYQKIRNYFDKKSSRAIHVDLT